MNTYKKDSNIYLDSLDRYKQQEKEKVIKETQDKVSKTKKLFEDELKDMKELNLFFDKYNTDSKYANSLSRKRKIIEEEITDSLKKKRNISPNPPPTSPNISSQNQGSSISNFFSPLTNLLNNVKEQNSDNDSDNFDQDFEAEEKKSQPEVKPSKDEEKITNSTVGNLSLSNPFNVNVNMNYPTKEKYYNEIRQQYGYKLTPVQSEIINDNDFLRSVYYFAKLVCTHKIFNWENQIWNTFDAHPDRIITKAFYSDFVNTLSDAQLKIKLERIFQPDLFTTLSMAVDLINENRVNSSKSKIRLASFLNNPRIYTYFAKYIQIKLQTSFKKVYKHQFDVLEKERMACFLSIVKLNDEEAL